MLKNRRNQRVRLWVFKYYFFYYYLFYTKLINITFNVLMKKEYSQYNNNPHRIQYKAKFALWSWNWDGHVLTSYTFIGMITRGHLLYRYFPLTNSHSPLFSLYFPSHPSLRRVKPWNSKIPTDFPIYISYQNPLKVLAKLYT